jgi:1,4-alpha-glucan branching enzyme
VEFTFTAPNAKKVSIAGQFNNWNPQTMPMKKEKNGQWKIKLKLPPGKCEYKFFVDGSWVNDTTSRESVPNSFGTDNSVINVH